MSERDFAIGSVGIPSVGATPKKPPYLVTLEPVAGSKKVSLFIALDKPDLLNGFIQVKGIYADATEDKITKNFVEILAETPKEEILDIMFPWHRVVSIRNLVFNANKPTSLAR